MGFALASIALGLAWDFAHERRLTGADLLKRWRPSAGKLRIAGFALALFVIATAFGVWRGFIPAALVVIMLGLVVAAPVLAAPFLFFHRRSAVKAKAAEAWPEVTGRVVDAFVTEAGGWPAPIVIYSYEVDGRLYRGSRLRFGGTGGMSPGAVEQVLAAYATGSEVAVFHDPKRPAKSVLLKGEAGASKSLLWGAGCMATAPLFGALAFGLMVVLGLVDAALTAIVGHRVLP
jgi:ribosomal protein L35AE/L33A